MSGDLDTLRVLREEVGVELNSRSSNSFNYGASGYILDAENRVIALALGKCALKAIPATLCQLNSLQILALRSNQLTNLPPEFARLQSLQTLDLMSNRFTSMPLEITRLHSLKTLYLSGNEITTLPPEVVSLQNLQALHLKSNGIAKFPLVTTKLQSLQGLYLSSNKLAQLPSGIADFKDLRTLYLSDNRLARLPLAITEIRSLQRLYLADNKIVSLPPEIAKLQGLQRLYLEGNRLTSLPLEIAQLQNLQALNLDENPLKSPPPEIANKGRDAVMVYLRSLEGEKRPLNEVKILMVGDGAVGKTSLVKRLVGEHFDPSEPQTHGINIRHWQVEEGGREILAHFWDFGGQEIMHATHQFFLSRRSVYVLVLDSRKDEKTETWLKTIESFGGNSPVLVVLNKIDENPSFDVNRRFLQEKYPGIQGFYPISCATDRGIEDLREVLQASLTKVEILETLWAESWFQVKQQLEKMEEHFVNYENYVDLCNAKGVYDKDAQNTLVDFLNDLGVIVHFQDFALRDIYVLEPKWVTEGVYKIINSEELAQGKGILELVCLTDILTPEDTYPREKHRYIIDLMKKFELCYEIDKSTVLLPDLLEIQEPDFVSGGRAFLRFRIDYDFLPRSVMPRFIVRMHRDIHQKLRWRTGVVLRSEAFQSSAVVKCDYDARRIAIRVSGPRRRDYFSAIIHSLREINGSFEKLGYIERVPLPDNPDAAVSYENLLRHEQAGVQEIMPDGAIRFYNVKDLLGTVQNERDRQEQILELQKEILAEVEETKKAVQPDVIEAKPSFMGVGVNLNALADKLKT